MHLSIEGELTVIIVLIEACGEGNTVFCIV
jgi:hypothetical protein